MVARHAANGDDEAANAGDSGQSSFNHPVILAVFRCRVVGRSGIRGNLGPCRRTG